MKPFKEVQFCWWLFIVIVPILIAMNFGVFNDPTRSFGSYHIVFNVTSIAILLFFYAMTTTIAGDKIIVSFGIGIIRKTIKISYLKNIDLVQNPFIYGWGIRSIPNGWLYNITGSDAVELQFSDCDTIVRIGSKDSALLRKQILQHIELTAQK